jgi:beta-carotene hydroxylase
MPIIALSDKHSSPGVCSKTLKKKLMNKISLHRKDVFLRPAIAWPTLALATGALALWALALYTNLPYGLGIVIATLCAYICFTPMHDATHGATSHSSWFNQFLGTLVGLPLMAPFSAFRVIHLQHHKHTNEVKYDPDRWSGTGPTWFLPVKWFTQDLHYYWFYFCFLKRPLKERLQVCFELTLMGILTWSLAQALGWSTILSHFILPARLASAALAFAFDYLPHVPHQIPAKVDRFAATRIMLNPIFNYLFLNQNYHLVHHLYPAVPFYRYPLAWQQKEKQLRAQGAIVQQF